MIPTRCLPALLAAGALVLAGCSAAPDDTAAAAAPTAFDEVLGTVVLDAQAGPPEGDAPRTRVLDAAALPDGRAHVLTAGATVRLVEVVRGDAGPAAGDAVELPGLGGGAELEVTADGDVLVVGSDDEGPVLLTVADGGVTERRVDDEGRVLASALSPDGGTVYVSLAPEEETGTPARLLAVDAATGEVIGSVPLGAGLDPRARTARLLPRPDGGVVAHISNPAPGGAQDWVAEYDADLGTVTAPFGVVAALGVDGRTEVSVGVADDGDVVVLTEVRDGRRVSRFSAGELLGTVDADFTGPVDAVVAGPPAGLVTLAWGRGGADPVLVTLDPATGELGRPLATCDTLGGHDALAVAPDGTWAVAAGPCGDDDVVALLVG
ncbi:YncE family protein [Geodermatophilus sp. SYSU D01045]